MQKVRNSSTLSACNLNVGVWKAVYSEPLALFRADKCSAIPDASISPNPIFGRQYSPRIDRTWGHLLGLIGAWAWGEGPFQVQVRCISKRSVQLALRAGRKSFFLFPPKLGKIP